MEIDGDGAAEAAAYGGPNWSPRSRSLHGEVGHLWRSCGVSSEWSPLEVVLLHRPGPELEIEGDPDKALMLEEPNAGRAAENHDAVANAYRELGVEVWYVDPDTRPPPNLVYVADLMFMTPEGAIVGRPASEVRAGEERWVAAALAREGVPILATVRGHGTFEGADAAWLDPETVLLAEGLRTNADGADQVASVLAAQEVEVVRVTLPYGSMHLMGLLRIVDRDLALVWRGRIPYRAVRALRSRGFEVVPFPVTGDDRRRLTYNFVTVGPREIVVPAGRRESLRFYEDLGIECHAVETLELTKAAGGIGCLTGVVARAADG